MSWRPTEQSIEKMTNEISENVINSNLPDAVKDQYADKNYDQIKPYDQSIKGIFHEYSLLMLMQSIKASSRALRNSDYVNPDIKRELLQVILRSWEQVCEVLLALTPMLAIKGNASFEGAGFILTSDHDNKDLSDRVKTILQNIPHNIINWFKSDIFSKKMGPLLFDQLNKEDGELKKHILALIVVYERPRNWHTEIQTYISSVSKNSFYLLSLYLTLRNQYSYAFVSSKTLLEIQHLVKMCIAKHRLGTKIPGKEALKKIPDSALPKRQVESPDL